MEDFFSACEPRLFAGLNCAQHGHFLQTFLQGFPQEVVAFLENLDDGVFDQEFDAAFFKGGHAIKLAKLRGSVKLRSRAVSAIPSGLPTL